jgi:hypothetical protein
MRLLQEAYLAAVKRTSDTENIFNKGAVHEIKEMLCFS